MSSLLATTALVINTISFHHVSGDFNEKNFGLGIEHSLNNNVYISAGGYENSYYDRSYYAGVGYEQEVSKYFKVGSEVFYATGYEEDGPFAAALTGSVGTDRFNIKVLHIPTYVTAIQLRMGF